MEGEIIILTISVIGLTIGILLWQKGNKLLINGKKADGIIFKNNYGGGGIYYPVVRFLTDKKEWITQELSIGYSPAKLEGTKLEVIYDQDDPTNVKINSAFQLDILPRLLVAIGLCGLMFGISELLDITQIVKE